jgi:hypothetical protein
VLPQGDYDVTASPANGIGNLFDRDSGSAWSSTGTETIDIALKAGKTATPVSIYTLTDGTDVATAPKSWTLKGSNDGTTWVELDKRENQAFLWPRQTRPFALKTPASYKQYRLELGSGAVTLAEFELLGGTPLDAGTPKTEEKKPDDGKPVDSKPVDPKPVDPKPLTTHKATFVKGLQPNDATNCIDATVGWLPMVKCDVPD